MKKSFYSYSFLTRLKFAILFHVFGLDTWQKYHKKWTDERMLRYGPKVLEIIEKVAKVNGAAWWLAWGSVLAYYREHYFIKGDNDIDIGMIGNDISIDFISQLIDEGFEFCYAIVNVDYKGFHIALNYKNVKVDLYSSTISDNMLTIYAPIVKDGKWNRSFKGKKFCELWGFFPYRGFSEGEFVGKKIYVYKNADEILRLSYGEDFMTPIPGKKAQESKNVNIVKPPFEESYSKLIEFDEFVELKKKGLL